MHLTFLSAAVPLTKTIAYSPRTGEYTTTSYPMVTNVTSEEVVVDNMEEFARQLHSFGLRSWSLLKGLVDRPLVDESRAGHAVTTAEHTWVCFDFDKVDCPPTFDGAVEAIYKYLPVEVHDVDAVIQLSASSLHPRARYLSAHIFMQLSYPVDTATLRDWLMSLNWTSPALQRELRLADSQRGLSYPLDSTVSSPAKLIYIAPPRTIGYTPQSTEFVQFLPGERRSFTLPHFKRVDANEVRVRVNEMREALGLGKLDYTVQTIGGQEFYKGEVEKGDELTIHDVKVSSSGHIRFNINGGDSLAYYVDLKRPNVIGNFKGEPFMFASEVAPKFYEQLRKAAPTAIKSQAKMSENTEILAFYATNRGSAVHIGTYDRDNDLLRVDRSSTEAAYAWLTQMGGAIGKAGLPHYDLAYDISSDVRYEEGYPVINLYARTEFIKLYGNIERTVPTDDILGRIGSEAPVFGKLLLSICGDDKDMVKRYINWLAFIFQERKKPGTAWLFWGTEGTGKGLLFEYMLKPIFGQDHCVQVLMKDIEGNFNSLLEGKLLVMIDEAEISRTRDPVEAMSRLRNWITEPKIVINEKHRVEESVPSFANFIVGANSTRPLMVSRGDRRWNVPPRQEVRITIYPNEMAVLEQGEELPAMAKLLGSVQVNQEWLRNPVESEAKKRLFEATHSMPEAVATALRSGDAGFFFAARPSSVQLTTGRALLPMSEYDDLLRAMVNGTLNTLTQDDLYVLFKVALPDDKQFPEGATAQRKLFRRLGFDEAQTRWDRRHNKNVFGYPAAEWQEVPDEFAELADTLTGAKTNNVTPIGAKK